MDLPFKIMFVILYCIFRNFLRAAQSGPFRPFAHVNCEYQIGTEQYVNQPILSSNGWGPFLGSSSALSKDIVNHSHNMQYLKSQNIQTTGYYPQDNQFISETGSNARPSSVYTFSNFHPRPCSSEQSNYYTVPSESGTMNQEPFLDDLLSEDFISNVETQEPPSQCPPYEQTSKQPTNTRGSPFHPKYSYYDDISRNVPGPSLDLRPMPPIQKKFYVTSGAQTHVSRSNTRKIYSTTQFFDILEELKRFVVYFSLPTKSKFSSYSNESISELCEHIWIFCNDRLYTLINMIQKRISLQKEQDMNNIDSPIFTSECSEQNSKIQVGPTPTCHEPHYTAHHVLKEPRNDSNSTFQHSGTSISFLDQTSHTASKNVTNSIYCSPRENSKLRHILIKKKLFLHCVHRKASSMGIFDNIRYKNRELFFSKDQNPELADHFYRLRTIFMEILAFEKRYCRGIMK